MDLKLITNPQPSSSSSTSKRSHSPGPDSLSKRPRPVVAETPTSVDPNTDPGGCTSDTEAGSPSPLEIPIGPIKTRYRVIESSRHGYHEGDPDVVIGTYSCRRYANDVAKSYLLREYTQGSFKEYEVTEEEESGLVCVCAEDGDFGTTEVRVERIRVRKMVTEVEVDDNDKGQSRRWTKLPKAGIAPWAHDVDSEDEDEYEDEDEDEDYE